MSWRGWMKDRNTSLPRAGRQRSHQADEAGHLRRLLLSGRWPRASALLHTGRLPDSPRHAALTFGFAPRPVGLTKAGQIVSAQRFVEGEPPTQVEVDEFLLREGLEPVKRSCWLWKKKDPNNEVEYWIGDARDDNFVKTPRGIVPIDLRMWGVPT